MGIKLIFIGYSCFENRLAKRKTFFDLINHNHLINTIYKDVTFDKGFSGLDFKETFLKEIIKKSRKTLISHTKILQNIP